MCCLCRPVHYPRRKSYSLHPWAHSPPANLPYFLTLKPISLKVTSADFPIVHDCLVSSVNVVGDDCSRYESQNYRQAYYYAQYLFGTFPKGSLSCLNSIIFVHYPQWIRGRSTFWKAKTNAEKIILKSPAKIWLKKSEMYNGYCQLNT